MPLSLRLTRSTSSACFAIGMLRWMNPKPPCRARAIARRDSVTVSMAALTTGIFKRTVFVRGVLVSTSVGSTELKEGTRRTSSKVSASASGKLTIRNDRRLSRRGASTNPSENVRSSLPGASCIPGFAPGSRARLRSDLLDRFLRMPNRRSYPPLLHESECRAFRRYARNSPSPTAGSRSFQ